MKDFLQINRTKDSEILSAAFRLEAVPINQDDILLELPLNGTQDTDFYLELLCLATRDDKFLSMVRRDVFLIVHMRSVNPRRNVGMLTDRATKLRGFLEKHNFSVSPVTPEAIGSIFQQTLQHEYHALARPPMHGEAFNRSTGLIQSMAETMEAGSSLAVIFAKSRANAAINKSHKTYPALGKKPQDVYRVAAFLTANKRSSLAKASLSLPHWQEYGVHPSPKTTRIHCILYSMRDLVKKDKQYPVLNLKQAGYLISLPTGNKTPFPNTVPTPVLNNIDSRLLTKSDGGRKIGTLLGLQQPRDIFMHSEHLAKHTAILGTSGSGKTSMLMNFMHECYRTGGINFLCLDVEGYDLKQIAPLTDADIYCAGQNTASPYPINPFNIEGLYEEDTCEMLQELLTNTLVDLWGPLPQFIVDTLKAMYNTSYRLERDSTHFLPLFEKIFDSKYDYGKNQKEMKTPAITRLRRLEELHGGSTPFNVDELLDRNTVIELGRMALDNRLFALCFILKAVITIQKKRYASNCTKNPLLIIIDEAHVLLQNNRAKENNAANYLIGLVNAIIKEGRKYGLYILLSDQSPQIMHDILPNINCKLIMKEEEETDTLATLLRSEDARLRLPVLKTGWAYLRVGDMDGALLIKAPQPLSLDTLDDHAVTKYMRERKRLKKLLPSVDAGINQLHETCLVSDESSKIKEMADYVVDTVLGWYAKQHDENFEKWFSLENLILDKYPQDMHLLPKVAKTLEKRYMAYSELSYIYRL